ncbi:MAG: hypothetical protein ACR2G6_10285 [Gemmatimonadaceae bacterium]
MSRLFAGPHQARRLDLYIRLIALSYRVTSIIVIGGYLLLLMGASTQEQNSATVIDDSSRREVPCCG